MRALKKLIPIFIITMLVVLSVGGAAFAASAQTGNAIYYFVNVGAADITATEKAYGLEGTLGGKDKAFVPTDGNDYGYTAKGAAGSAVTDTVFSSYSVGASEYKFEIDSGSYTVSVGFNLASASTILVNGEETIITDGNNVVKAVPVVGGEITVAIGGSGNLSFIMVTQLDAKVLVHADVAKVEVVQYGAVVNSVAKGYYSDGTTGDVSLDYKNLNANDINQNFMSTEASAVVRGTNYEVPRVLFTAPSELVYYVNAGSQKTAALPEDIDVYEYINDVVMDYYPNLKNEVIDQQYNNNWGYTAYNSDFPVSSKQMPTKPGDPYPPLYPFNTIRCIDKAPYGIEYKFAVDSGSYNIYVGTRSHWHGRKVVPYINGEAQTQFNLDPVNRITEFKNVSDVEGQLKVEIRGLASQDEGSIAFIAIQPANDTTLASAIPSVPTLEGNLNLGDTQFSVGNVKANTKIQVSLAETPYSVIYEGLAAADGTYDITLNEETLNDVYKLRVAAVSNGGASDYVELYITDITDFLITPASTSWTAGSVELNLSARSKSGIVKMEVEFNYFTTETILEGDLEYATTYTANENGIYTFKLFSGVGAFYTKTMDVTNIDNKALNLSVTIASSGFSDGKIALKFVKDGVADVSKFTVFSDGVAKSDVATIPEIVNAEYGDFVYSITTSSGKSAALSLLVSQSPKYFSAQSTYTNDGAKISVTGNSGKEIKTVYVYKVSEDSAARVTVTGTEFNIYDGGDYIVMTLYSDGLTEVARLSLAATKEVKASCKSDIGSSAVLMAVIFGGGCLLISIRFKKKGSKSN